ncbi:hypothetical protein KUDE01_029018, partial [Dissostichus eleginoides]
ADKEPICLIDLWRVSLCGSDCNIAVIPQELQGATLQTREKWMERAGVFEKENLVTMKEREERGVVWRRVGTQLWLGQQKKKDQKPGESPISSEKCLSQEKREPLGQMSHRERLKKQIWAELDSHELLPYSRGSAVRDIHLVTPYISADSLLLEPRGKGASLETDTHHPGFPLMICDPSLTRLAVLRGDWYANSFVKWLKEERFIVQPALLRGAGPLSGGHASARKQEECFCFGFGG